MACNGGIRLGKQKRSVIDSQAFVAYKERRQQTIIGMIVVLIVMALVGVIGITAYKASHPSESLLSKSSTTSLQSAAIPSNANKQGGFLVSASRETKNVPTIEIYFDPMCPSCGLVDRALNPTLLKLYDAGQVNMELHPVSFLDKASSDRYSTRAASSLAYVGEHDPQHLLAYLGGLFEKGFQPSETDYHPVSDAQLVQQAIRCGVNETVAKKSTCGEYEHWIEHTTEATINRKELQQSDSGSFSTPLIRINGNFWSMKNMLLKDLPTALLTSLGLPKDSVGDNHVLPEIGSEGKPL
jgi:protein-disulfide isomerase